MKNPKISVVMQSYLGEYDGSRKNPVEKFHRAVKSFLDNTYKNSELVVVSDGCKITHYEYHTNYLENNRIKYAYVSKPISTLMYSKQDGQNFFRGVPRKIGVSLSEGELVTYLDSDDYLTSDALDNIIINGYGVSPDSDWWINRTYFYHKILLDIWNLVLKNRELGRDYNKGFDKLFEILDTDSFNEGQFIFPNIDSQFVKTRIRPGLFSGITSLTTHRRTCKVDWKDTVDISEDFAFGRELREKYNGFYYDAPGYVRCHYRGVWDV